MRMLVVVGFLASMVYAVCVAKTCKRIQDCAADECCVRTLVLSYCQKLKEEGELCVIGIENKKDGDIEKFTCPCGPGLTCVNTGKGDLDTIPAFFKTKCVKK